LREIYERNNFEVTMFVEGFYGKQKLGLNIDRAWNSSERIGRDFDFLEVGRDLKELWTLVGNCPFLMLGFL
jgi:hypothetical protein